MKRPFSKSSGCDRTSELTDELPVFNLIHEPWLPVLRRSGQVDAIQPWRVTERIDDDPCVAFAWPRPDFNGAAYEFLIGLLATGAAPEDDRAWKRQWLNPPLPEALRERFSAVAHAFDLDGTGPRFLQDLDPLEGVKEKAISALLIDTPGAQTLRNNADLFVKRGAAPVLSRAAAAMSLFTLNCYAPSGGVGHRTSLRGGGPMTTLIVAEHPRFGETLWSRLWPNVESRQQVAERATRALRRGEGRSIFPWLSATVTSNPKANGRATTPENVHPLQVYWGMPRRIRLNFEEAKGRHCGLTASEDRFVATAYRTRNYGINYSEGFRHPLTPYYRQNAKKVAWLPVHPQPGGISYRLWPGLVVRSRDGLREPAAVARHWQQARAHGRYRSRFVAFGYDMDNMKARAWTEGEMPIWQLNDDTHEELTWFIQRVTAGGNAASRLLIGAVKSALHDNPRDVKGDHGYIAERFFRETEGMFYSALDDAVHRIGIQPDLDDPTVEVRRRWARRIESTVLRLFDEYVPAEGLENRDMHRHVQARFLLVIALRGYGRAGRALFEGELDIPAPKTSGFQGKAQEAA